MLLDTSGLFSLIDPREPAHARAAKLYRGATERITHSYVAAEFVALADARRFNRQETLAFAVELINDPGVVFVWVDERLHRAALELLLRRPDKGYSLCDAVSFVLMRERDQAEALTTDRHFEQGGFRRLLVEGQ